MVAVEHAAVPTQARGARWALAGLVVALVLLADQGTKALVRGSIDPGEQHDVLGPLSFVNVHNRGVAFGFLGGGGRDRPRRHARGAGAAARLLRPACGAAAAVAADRPAARRRARQPARPPPQGYVTDFIDLPHWPAFNVADMCITGGVVALLLVLELRWKLRLRIEVDAAAEGERLDRCSSRRAGSARARRRSG